MRRILVLTAIIMIFQIALMAQQHRNPPQFNISVPPTSIMFSYYDYMVGGYHDSPVKLIPDNLGGGVVTAFHASPDNASFRTSYLAYINQAGALENIDNVMAIDVSNGYPSFDYDEESGLGFLAWHSQTGTTDNYFVNGAICLHTTEPDDMISTPYPIMGSDAPGESYLWPVVKFAPSPFQGMRRLYVMGIRRVTDPLPGEAPKLAYTDFVPSEVTYDTVFSWNYISVPEIEGWTVHLTERRRCQFTFLVGPDGTPYICGYHEAYVIETNESIDEPNLDVFVFESTNPDVWTHQSIHAEQEPSVQPGPEFDYNTDVLNSSHFNAVMNGDGKILFPQLHTFVFEESNNEYSMPSLYTVKQIVFDTMTNTFRIDDLWPQGASPHSAPAYTPWDVDEDGFIDQQDDEGNPIFSATWPFPYWDDTANSNAMMFYYNLQLMTEPNEQGWMACVWEDSKNALGSGTPELYGPDICISLSPDNGWTWLEPIVLNGMEIPALSGIIPMWVYPADKIKMVGETDSTQTGRLFLMFYDDISWGAACILPAPIEIDGGYVSYMAIDLTLPLTANDDQFMPVPNALIEQIYPNPFNAQAEVRYTLKQNDKTILSIYNIKGQLVKTLVDENLKAGSHTVVWDGIDSSNKTAANGVYFCRLNAGGKVATAKLVLLK